jgi:hypothetical protein
MVLSCSFTVTWKWVFLTLVLLGAPRSLRRVIWVEPKRCPIAHVDSLMRILRYKPAGSIRWPRSSVLDGAIRLSDSVPLQAAYSHRILNV